MTPVSHPPAEFLMEYAAGSLSAPLALVIATHVALCSSCQVEVSDYEKIGGALLDRLTPAPLHARARERLMGLLDHATEPPIAASASERDPLIPAPLAPYVPPRMDDWAWTTMMPGVRRIDLDVASPGIRTRILRVKPGRALPRHAHGGLEMSCVLSGEYSDGIGRYKRGDFIALVGDVEHRPVAGAGEDCICLVVTDGPVRLTGKFVRFLNRFVSR